MARIFKFPEGTLIQDGDLPVDPDQQLLQSIIDNPESTVEQIKQHITQISAMSDVILKIYAYLNIEPSANWSKQIKKLIESNLNIAVNEEE
mgnify:CR=1 FL=1